MNGLTTNMASNAQNKADKRPARTADQVEVNACATIGPSVIGHAIIAATKLRWESAETNANAATIAIK